MARKTKITTALWSGVSALSLVPARYERARRSRPLRDPEGHAAGGGEGGAGGDAGAAGAGAGDQGGADGAGAAGAGDQGGGDAEGPATVLGEAAAAGDGAGADAKGEGEGGEAKKKEGEAEGGAGDGAALQVLGAPEAYDLKLPDGAPEGMQFDKEAFAAVEPVLREMDLSADAAQKLVDVYASKVIPLIEKRAGERSDAGAAAMRKGWEAEARADPELGGAKWKETLALSAATMTRFGIKSDGPFMKLLEESGLGSHPDMLRFMSNVGRATGEAKSDSGAGGGGQARLADRIYGKPIKGD